MHPNQSVHVCQRCCNPLKLSDDLHHLEAENVLALVDAQCPDTDETRPPVIIPIKNAASNYPRYFVPPNPKLPNSDTESLASFLRRSTPTTSLDHRQQVSAYLFDVLSGRTDVDHPLCQECADVLLTAKQQSLEYQEEELTCLRTYISYLDTKAAQREIKTKAFQTPSSSTHRSTELSHVALRPSDSNELSSVSVELPSTVVNWVDCSSSSEKLDAPASSHLGHLSLSGNDENSDGDLSEDGRIDEACFRGSMSLTDKQSKLGDRTPKKRQPALLSELQETVEDLQSKLSHVLLENMKLDQHISNDTAELERVQDELNNAQTRYNEQKLALLEAEEELFSIEARIAHAEHHLQRLLHTNVLNTAFPIWYDGHFCIINGLHLGRLSNRPISWEEINAAWGQCAMLLQCIAKKLNHNFRDYRIVPLGSQSKVVDLSTLKEYPLYYTPTGMQLFGVSKFDTAMCLFLKCLSQVQTIIEDLTQTKLHYCIKDGGKIHNPEESKAYSIKWSGNSEENWTKALKMMLLNMKWIIARLAAIEGQRNPNRHVTGQQSATEW